MHLLAGSYTEAPYAGAGAGGPGVALLEFSPEDRRFAILGTLGLRNPSYLASVPGSGVFLAVEELAGPETGLAAFRLVGNGFERWWGQSTGGVGACHVLATADGALAVVSHYNSGSVGVVPLARPSEVQHIVLTGSGPVPERQTQPHAHFAFEDRDGSVIVVDLGSDSLLIFPRKGDRLDAEAMRRVALPPGSGPRHLVRDSSGQLQVATELSSEVLTLRDDFSVQARVSTRQKPGGINSPSAIVAHPRHPLLWVANRGDNDIATLGLAEGVRLSSTARTGNWPRDLALSADGRWLFAANQRAGTVVAFAVDDSGGLAPAASIDFPCAATLLPLGPRGG